ncbi:MAG TPA: MBL fold metallo-hydrolase [Firmicutes bacterium]|nr:MBL fold metallo-hydrolase [Bacillota bacterium]
MGVDRVRIRWLGHACFLITAPDGTRILTDPFDETVGYRVPDVESEIVTVSHDHFDHNNVRCVRGNPVVVDKPGEHEVRGIKISGIPTFHDEVHGKKRGTNTVFVMDVGGFRLAHLGDLGEKPAKEVLDGLGHVDILMIPVGGYYTIDAGTASELVEELEPSIAIPMHYKTPAISFPIAEVDKFLAGKERVERRHTTTLEVSRPELPRETTIVVLDYE